MKCNIKKLATMLIILFGVPQTVIAQTFSFPTGTTAQDPFTNLDVIHQINGAGTYYFHIDGKAFRTFVDSAGYISVYADVIPVDLTNDSISSGRLGATPRVTYIKRTDTFSNPMVSSDLEYGKGYLTDDILADMGHANSLKITSFPVNSGNLPTRLNATTDAQTYINRVLENQMLGQGIADAPNLRNTWTGTGAVDHLRQAACASAYRNKPLTNSVFHACGFSTGVHWFPQTQIGGGSNWGRFSIDNSVDFSSDPSPSRLLAGSQIMLLLKFEEAKLLVSKTASAPNDPAQAGDVISYTYNITNKGSIPAINVAISDMHIAEGTFDQPNIETATLSGSSGQSSNADTLNGTYDALGPNDVLTVTSTYTVTEQDIIKYGTE